jgi:hypothetical protein
MKLKFTVLALMIPVLVCFFAATAKAGTTWQSVGPFGGSIEVAT